MKKLFLFFIFLISFKQVNSATLVFNQILTYSGFTDVAGSILYYVVPANKTWKIEYIKNQLKTSSDWVIKISTGSGFSNLPDHSGLVGLPASTNIWLKANDSISIQGYPGSSKDYMLSIIEYNIVP